MRATTRAVAAALGLVASLCGAFPAEPPMGLPSTPELRGQRDTVGFASTAAQMAASWELGASGPEPDALGAPPTPGVAAVIAPHDDYLYAGRVYRRLLPLVTAKTVVVVGVFHGYRRFGVRDRLVFDPFPAWRTPDGPVGVAALREDVLQRLPPEDVVQDAAMHDAEHSVEALVYWLRHQRPDLEILPVIVPAARFERLEELARHAGSALAASLKKGGRQLGRDVAIVISADATHYGRDFRHTPFGEGGVDPYVAVVRRDKDLLRGMAGPLTAATARRLYETFVDPENPDTYRVTWCGRFSIPFGLLLLEATARELGQGTPTGHPVAYATSVGWPELPLRDTGLGETAPANLYHFVGYPAVAFTVLPAK